MHLVRVVALVSAVACSSSEKDSGATSEPAGKSAPGPTGRPPVAPPSGEGSTQTYSLTTTGSGPPVKVQASIPSSWTADTSGADGPTFTVSGADLKLLTFTAISLDGDDGARITKAIRMQFDDATGAERAELSGGRVWMTAPQGDNIHARIFVPSPDGVVMGFALVSSASADRLPEIRSVFETLAVVP